MGEGDPRSSLRCDGSHAGVLPGRFVVGAGSALAITEVIGVAADGLVHVRPLPGPVTEERLTGTSQRV